MDSSAPGRLCFNTDTLPERDRFPAYCEEMIRRYAALDIMARDDGSKFRARIELQRIGSVDIGYVATTASDYVRTPPYLRDGDDALCVVLCIEGGTYQTQRGDPQPASAARSLIATQSPAACCSTISARRKTSIGAAPGPSLRFTISISST